jgi:hypothetical protein
VGRNGRKKRYGLRNQRRTHPRPLAGAARRFFFYQVALLEDLLMRYCSLIVLCLFILVHACHADPVGDSPDQETNNFKAVAEKWVELLDDGKLPGISSFEHGKTYGYPLTKEIKKTLLDKGTVNQKMLMDVKDYRDSYILGAMTADNRNYAYLFYVANGSVEMVSAYQFETNGWTRIFRR